MWLLLCFFVADLEAAFWPATAIAAFLNGGFDNFCDERFSEATYFGVDRYGGGQRTAVALNRQFVFILHDLGGAADRLQH